MKHWRCPDCTGGCVLHPIHAMPYANMVYSSFSEFKLDLPQTENMAIGDYLSKRLSAGGDYPWTILCYPRGFNEEDGGEYVSLELYMPYNPKVSVAFVVFEAFVMGTDDYSRPITSHAKRTAKDDAFFHSVPWDRFLKRNHLGSSFHDTNGVVTIVCGIIVQRDDDCIAVPGSDIGTHLGRILGCADGGSDVSFLVAGETFPAHRAVLAARSPVFRAELFGPMAAEATTAPRVTLHDIDPATFKLLLHFIYTDALPADTEPAAASSVDATFQRLLAAADRYALNRLKLLCAQKLWDNVAADTVADAMASAEMHGCPELKEKCMDFFVAEQNFKRAMLTEGFVRLGQRFPSIIAQLRQRAGIY